MVSNRNFIYNQFLSDIIYNRENTPSLELEHCEEVLNRVAIVKIMMVPNDAVVLEERARQSISVFTGSGGILGLYAGFSFLSLGEVIFWIVRTMLYVPMEKMKSL